jgi:hypothetical protein
VLEEGFRALRYRYFGNVMPSAGRGVLEQLKREDRLRER